MPAALNPKRTASQKEQAVSFAEGTNLYEDGSRKRQILLLNAGQVRLTGRNGVIFDHLKRGSFLGEKFLLSSNATRGTATALAPVDAVPFRIAELEGEFRRDPDLAVRMVKDLAMRLDRYEELICDLVTEQAEVRLARLLLRVAPARPANRWARLPFSFTNVELAKMIGTTRWRFPIC
jgi:CRP/FNR family cyclic AMP-dependent transcriptional regulator